MRDNQQKCALAIGLLAAACSGSVSSNHGSGNAGTDGQGGGAGTGIDPMDPNRPPDVPMIDACKTVNPGPAPIRRLTRFEFNNSVRDLVGDSTNPADMLPAEERANGFDNNAEALTVSPALGEKYLSVAESIADRATTMNMAMLLGGCDTAKTGEDACADKFIADFGKRAYRRPVPTEEVKVLKDVYTAGKTSAGFANGIRLALATILMSPRFLYRVEFGQAPMGGQTVVPLDSWEMATRLSYLIWESTPDGPLLTAAEAGELATRAQISTQVDRMLADGKASASTTNFHQQWLRLDKLATVTKDAAIFPKFTPALLPLMAQETVAMLNNAVWKGAGTVEEMFTGKYTFVNTQLATYYGLPDPKSQTPVKVDLLAGHGSGLLAQGSVMTMNAHPNQGSPVQRGKFIREQLMCSPLPPPPANIKIDVPAISKTATTRERFEMHRTDPACGGCHIMIDPVGLGLENFDAVGVWHDQENGKAIDSSGQIVGLDGEDKMYNGPVELAQLLGASKAVSECVRDNWFVFGYGRSKVDADACSAEFLAQRFENSGHNVKDLLRALTETDAFLYRPASTVGGSP